MSVLDGFGVRGPSPVVEVVDRRLGEGGVRVLLVRDDLVGADLPGNKWRKLKYNLVAAREQGHRRLLTFGGAYSNHVRAVAAAGERLGFSTVGVIRGEERVPVNPSLAYAVARGMRLVYLDRGAYRRKTEPEVLAGLLDEFGPAYVLPEGGSNSLAVKGCAELPGEIDVPFDVICCACGTGGTLAGIASGLVPGQRAVGFSVLKGGPFLDDEVRRLQGRDTGNWVIDYDFHFGGYAKRTPVLDGFVDDFRVRHGVTLDWVYEAKMMYGLLARIAEGAFTRGTVIVAVLA